MSRQLRNAVGILLSVLLLWLALKDVSFREVLRRVQDADLAYFTLAIVISLATFWIRAYRWGILLEPVAGSIPFRPRLSATFIGFAVNNVLPGRVGEFARVFSLSKLTSVPVASAFATLVIERMLDGLVLIALLFGMMALPDFPGLSTTGEFDVGAIALTMAGVMVAVGCAFTVAASAPRLAGRLARFLVRPLPGRFREPALNLMRSFGAGLAMFRSPRLFAASAALAIFQWVFAGLSFLFAFRAFDIQTVPFSGALFLQSFLSFMVAIPSSPGFFGPFEWASKIGLALWGIPEEQAVSFALAFHIGGFIPVVVIGVYYIWRLNLSWSSLSHAEQNVDPDGVNPAHP